MHASVWDIHLVSLKLIIISHEIFNQKPTFAHIQLLPAPIKQLELPTTSRNPVWSDWQQPDVVGML